MTDRIDDLIHRLDEGASQLYRGLDDIPGYVRSLAERIIREWAGEQKPIEDRSHEIAFTDDDSPPVAGELRELVKQEVKNVVDDFMVGVLKNSTLDRIGCEAADRILGLWKTEPGLVEAQKAIYRIVSERDRVREVTLPSKLNAAIEMAARLMGDIIASAPRDDPKPTDIAGNHTGMHWDGLAGVWRRDATPRNKSKEGGG